MIMQFFLGGGGGGEGWVNRFIMEFLEVDNYADQAEFFFFYQIMHDGELFH